MVLIIINAAPYLAVAISAPTHEKRYAVKHALALIIAYILSYISNN